MMSLRNLPALILVVAASSATAGEASMARSSAALSRITIGVPLLTHHFPRNNEYNNRNWGVMVDVAVVGQWSVVGGYFKNSYERETLFAGAGWYPLKFHIAGVRLDLGAIAGLDLSGGYKDYNRAYPLLGALSMKIRSGDVSNPDAAFLNRIGLAFTLLPAVSGRGSTAINLALTYRL